LPTLNGTIEDAGSPTTVATADVELASVPSEPKL
jgi:hypothetical protein